jgi:hypothetical protein
VRFPGREIEFPDIRARDERAPRANQHDRRGDGVQLRFIEAIDESPPDRLRQGIDGRVIDGDYRHRSVALQTDRVHLSPPQFFADIVAKRRGDFDAFRGIRARPLPRAAMALDTIGAE